MGTKSEGGLGFIRKKKEKTPRKPDWGHFSCHFSKDGLAISDVMMLLVWSSPDEFGGEEN